jgi:hypothetical protein
MSICDNIPSPTVSVYSQVVDFSEHPMNSLIYQCDNIDIEYSLSGSVVTITVTFNDGTLNATNITGNLTVTAVARPPSTTYITNSWGTPVVAVSAAA